MLVYQMVYDVSGMAIPPINNADLGDGLWHCCTHIFPIALWLFNVVMENQHV